MSGCGALSRSNAATPGFGSHARRLAATIFVLLITVAATGCQNSKPAAVDPLARGRVLYTTNCAVCHNADPNLPGTLGPPIAGSSRELVEARVLHAAYPSGYKPKRTSHVMQPLPWLAPNIDDLTAFLDAAAQQHGVPHK